MTTYPDDQPWPPPIPLEPPDDDVPPEPDEEPSPVPDEDYEPGPDYDYVPPNEDHRMDRYESQFSGPDY